MMLVTPQELRGFIERRAPASAERATEEVPRAVALKYAYLEGREDALSPTSADMRPAKRRGDRWYKDACDQAENRRKLEETINKLTWQVRDTCTRAERAECALRLCQAALRCWTDLYAKLQNESGERVSRVLDYNLPPGDHVRALEAIEEHFKAGQHASASSGWAHGEEGGKIVDAERPSNEQQAAGDSGPTTGAMVRSEPVAPASSAESFDLGYAAALALTTPASSERPREDVVKIARGFVLDNYVGVWGDLAREIVRLADAPTSAITPTVGADDVDARRYRRIRQSPAWYDALGRKLWGEELDAAVDAAMARSEGTAK
jgi:hypothetical protein